MIFLQEIGRMHIQDSHPLHKVDCKENSNEEVFVNVRL